MWPARLGKFKASLSPDRSEREKQKSLLTGIGNVAYGAESSFLIYHFKLLQSCNDISTASSYPAAAHFGSYDNILTEALSFIY